jgi:hypothetical protein
VATGTCPHCGRRLDDVDRHVRLILPDPVRRVPERERAPRTWGSERGPFIEVQGIGAFVRVLLPIRLRDVGSLTVGTWLGIDPSRLRDIWELWNTPAYVSLELDGYLANAVEPWGEAVLGARASAAVRDPSEIPYLKASSNVVLQRVLTDEWPHDEILEPYRSVL